MKARETVPPGVPAPANFVHPVREALASRLEGVDPWFHSYHGELLDDRKLRKWARAHQQMFALVGGVRGKFVVDAGSGFGMVANLMGCLGARAVLGIEVHAPMARSNAIVNAAFFPHLRDRVFGMRADVSRLPIRAASADLVVSIEAISHYYDVDAFLDECARVLRPGGQLMVSDGNNGANPRIRAATIELWRRLEMGPEGPCGDVIVPEPMVSRRERIVREAFPQLAAERVAHLARLTAGLDRAQVVDAVRAHLAGGPEPSHPYRVGDCPREPQWGYWLEQLFDARELAARLERRGFTARALPHFGGAANDLHLAANLVLRTLPTHRWAKAYRLVARRK